MAHGFFHDEHGDKSASRLMSFITLIAVLAWATKLVWEGAAIPEIPWAWVAVLLGFYLIGKVGQPTTDFLFTAVAKRIGIPTPEAKP